MLSWFQSPQVASSPSLRRTDGVQVLERLTPLITEVVLRVDKLHQKKWGKETLQKALTYDGLTFTMTQFYNVIKVIHIEFSRAFDVQYDTLS